MDVFMLGSTVFIFATLVELAIVSWTSRKFIADPSKEVHYRTRYKASDCSQSELETKSAAKQPIKRRLPKGPLSFAGTAANSHPYRMTSFHYKPPKTYTSVAASPCSCGSTHPYYQPDPLEQRSQVATAREAPLLDNDDRRLVLGNM